MSDTQPFTSGTFLAAFPEFNNPAIYPAAQVSFWLSLANGSLDATRWGQWLEVGTYLFVAHNLVLSARAAAQAARGGTPGQAIGPIASKSIGGGSLGYDTGSVTWDAGGHWNLTDYGNRYLSMARLVGSGGVQIGYGPMPPWQEQPWFGPLGIMQQ